MRISSIFYFKYNTFSRRYLVPILAVSRCPISPLMRFSSVYKVIKRKFTPVIGSEKQPIPLSFFAIQ